MSSKVIVTMGATTSGKMVLISHDYYVFNVQWEDPFRNFCFQLFE